MSQPAKANDFFVVFSTFELGGITKHLMTGRAKKSELYFPSTSGKQELLHLHSQDYLYIFCSHQYRLKNLQPIKKHFWNENSTEEIFSTPNRLIDAVGY